MTCNFDFQRISTQYDVFFLYKKKRVFVIEILSNDNFIVMI